MGRTRTIKIQLINLLKETSCCSLNRSGMLTIFYEEHSASVYCKVMKFQIPLVNILIWSTDMGMICAYYRSRNQWSSDCMSDIAPGNARPTHRLHHNVRLNGEFESPDESKYVVKKPRLMPMSFGWVSPSTHKPLGLRFCLFDTLIRAIN